MTPHAQLAVFADILSRHPDLRRSFRQALGVETTQLARPDGRQKPPEDERRIVMPGDFTRRTIQ
jgi:hypothetical protein